MKCMIVVLAVASLCLAEPEADPLHYYAPYPYLTRPYAASGYASPLIGGYQAVHRLHRLHKREADAEADPQLLLNAGFHFPAAAPVAPLVAPVAAPVVPTGIKIFTVPHAVAHAPVV